MLTVLLVLAVLIAGLLAYAATRPDTAHIARSTVIAASPEAIYPHIASPRAMNEWNPFVKDDPAARLDYSGPESGVGAMNTFGGGKSGAGTCEVVAADPPRSVTFALKMTKPVNSENRVLFLLVPEAGGTRVTWDMQGKVPFFFKVVGIFFNHEKMCGDAFDRGLADLKQRVES